MAKYKAIGAYNKGGAKIWNNFIFQSKLSRMSTNYKKGRRICCRYILPQKLAKYLETRTFRNFENISYKKEVCGVEGGKGGGEFQDS